MRDDRSPVFVRIIVTSIDRNLSSKSSIRSLTPEFESEFEVKDLLSLSIERLSYHLIAYP